MSYMSKRINVQKLLRYEPYIAPVPDHYITLPFLMTIIRTVMSSPDSTKYEYKELEYEPLHEKTNNLDFRHGPAPANQPVQSQKQARRLSTYFKLQSMYDFCATKLLHV